VTVGETLAEARTSAGLSVDEISERTRIRQAVIRGIERDDYDSCGGDVFVRGYVRVLADAVGIDAQPLIDEYEQSHVGGASRFDVSASAGTPVSEPAAEETAAAPEAVRPAEETRYDLPAADISDTVDDIPVIRLDDTVSDLEPVPAIAVPPPAEPHPNAIPLPQVPPRRPLTAPTRVLRSMAPRLQPSPSGRTRRWAAGGGRRRTVGLAMLAVVALAVVAVAGTLIASNVNNGSPKSTISAGQRALALNTPPAATGAGKKGKPTVQAAPAPKATPSPRATKPAVRPAKVKPLAVSAAEAFGPDGTADGDNAGSAMYAVRSGSPQPWQTDWYTSAQFGQLKQGTGLLLDMGSAVTATTVRIDLGAYSGADLQLRVGDEPSLDSMKVKATANGAGGTVYLHLNSPVSAPYLLIWFTLLPPNGSDQYQASVYSVSVTGRS
jgi:transcriptional regulator with XRE-family HTH domain